MDRELRGRARKFGDDVNTDYIITSQRKRESLDGAVLRQYLFETIDPTFAASVEPGDFIVAGRNFGCGSAMEVAVTVILAAGIKAVLAQSFSRSFYRNSINNGLLPVACDTSLIAEGAALTVKLDGAKIDVIGASIERPIHATPMTPILAEIIDVGGIVAYVRAQHARQG